MSVSDRFSQELILNRNLSRVYPVSLKGKPSLMLGSSFTSDIYYRLGNDIKEEHALLYFDGENYILRYLQGEGLKRNGIQGNGIKRGGLQGNGIQREGLQGSGKNMAPASVRLTYGDELMIGKLYFCYLGEYLILCAREGDLRVNLGGERNASY